MAFYLVSNGGYHFAHTREIDSARALIQVPASEQQVPGALHWCPVCGQVYSAASLPVFAPHRQAAPEEQQLLCCLECGTYAVGVLVAPSEESRVPGV